MEDQRGSDVLTKQSGRSCGKILLTKHNEMMLLTKHNGKMLLTKHNGK